VPNAFSPGESPLPLIKCAKMRHIVPQSVPTQVCGTAACFADALFFFAGGSRRPLHPGGGQGRICYLVCLVFWRWWWYGSCGASLRPLPPFMAREGLVLRHELPHGGIFPQTPCNAPRLSRAALRRSHQKMKISFFESTSRRPNDPLCRRSLEPPFILVRRHIPQR